MKIFITVDLGFGDSGKGTIVDALVRRYNAGLIVRYSGGCQASHTVYDEAGDHHSFSQYGSTFVPSVNTLLSRYVQVNPLIMQQETEMLEAKGVVDPLSRMYIDGRALMTTPYHRAVNRLRELCRGSARHGSVGQGIGETMADSLLRPDYAVRMGDMHDFGLFATKLGLVRARMRSIAAAMNVPESEMRDKQLSTFDVEIEKVLHRYAGFYARVGPRILDEFMVARLLTVEQAIVFEAAQGVLLDENFGFHPHTTWSTTTMRNAKLILEEAEIKDKPTTIGIIRSYMTRHGAGPFPTESQEMNRVLKDPNNPHNPWQEDLRFGPLDLPLLRYALRVNGAVDCLAVTHMDLVTNKWPICTFYNAGGLLATPTTLEEQEKLGLGLASADPVITHGEKAGLKPEIENGLNTPIAILSEGPTPFDKMFFGPLADKIAR